MSDQETTDLHVTEDQPDSAGAQQPNQSVSGNLDQLVSEDLDQSAYGILDPSGLDQSSIMDLSQSVPGHLDQADSGHIDQADSGHLDQADSGHLDQATEVDREHSPTQQDGSDVDELSDLDLTSDETTGSPVEGHGENITTNLDRPGGASEGIPDLGETEASNPGEEGEGSQTGTPLSPCASGQKEVELTSVPESPDKRRDASVSDHAESETELRASRESPSAPEEEQSSGDTVGPKDDDPAITSGLPGSLMDSIGEDASYHLKAKPSARSDEAFAQKSQSKRDPGGTVEAEPDDQERDKPGNHDAVFPDSTEKRTRKDGLAKDSEAELADEGQKEGVKQPADEGNGKRNEGIQQPAEETYRGKREDVKQPRHETGRDRQGGIRHPEDDDDGYQKESSRRKEAKASETKEEVSGERKKRTKKHEDELKDQRDDGQKPEEQTSRDPKSTRKPLHVRVIRGRTRVFTVIRVEPDDHPIPDMYHAILFREDSPTPSQGDERSAAREASQRAKARFDGGATQRDLETPPGGGSAAARPHDSHEVEPPHMHVKTTKVSHFQLIYPSLRSLSPSLSLSLSPVSNAFVTLNVGEGHQM